MKPRRNEWWPGRRGAGLTEYILLAGLIGLFALGVVMLFGDDLRALFGVAGNALAAGDSAPAPRSASLRGRPFGWDKLVASSVGSGSLLHAANLERTDAELEAEYSATRQALQAAVATEGATWTANVNAAWNALDESPLGRKYKALLVQHGVTPSVSIFNIQQGLANYDQSTHEVRINAEFLHNGEIGSVAAIAGLIAHEAVHLEYQMDPQGWLSRTLADNPQLAPRIQGSHNIGQGRMNSIDQEYQAFTVQQAVYNSLRDIHGADINQDIVTDMGVQGEGYLKNVVRNFSDYQGLPEY